MTARTDSSICTLSPCSAAAVGTYLLSQRPNGRLLDVGCGRGELLTWLFEHSDYGLYGTEPNESLRRTARAACPAAQILGARMEALPWRENSFDLLYFGCTLSLAEDPDTAWGEIRRLLALRGCLVVADVYAPEDSYRMEASMLRRVARLSELECTAERNGFVCTDFSDRSRDLTQWALQMMWDGFDPCLTDLEPAWRSMKAGYAFWTFNRP